MPSKFSCSSAKGLNALRLKRAAAKFILLQAVILLLSPNKKNTKERKIQWIFCGVKSNAILSHYLLTLSLTNS